MKNLWFTAAIIGILLVTSVVSAYAQQATAYATVLIIIPERPQQTAQANSASEEKEETSVEAKETSAKDEALLEKTALTEDKKDEIALAPKKVQENTYILGEL